MFPATRDVPASTGPRFCDRGEELGGLLLAIRKFASTGPRFCDRGEFFPVVELYDPETSFNGATIL